MKQPTLQPVSPSERWNHTMMLLSKARENARVMTDRKIPSERRDDATEAYIGAVDKLVAHLGHLKEIGALDEVTDYLATVFDRPV
ncbi:hypothetical protein RHVG_00007 [Rhodovulum phage RS1]|uniref:hypothetical protein n=1 Tax=Rhodobacter phage RC1 TaxID=754055 RepID=UPI0002C18507|nr:hypothetical protein RHWG_00049 [Rhodobacter phage RC1]YP_007676386.1 hypothetical protein RHVG_00007 [Rhodovulum phage RS1]AGH57972.1 hypothetical protein RHVG_00007 [Rhodovulum phage RS1]AGH58070.1 hypothetical protein RHWG_00049 [Rhodobacter phage RC1]